jgi:hypothetical protein
MLARNGDATWKPEDEYENADQGSADDSEAHERYVVPEVDAKSNKSIHHGYSQGVRDAAARVACGARIAARQRIAGSQHAIAWKREKTNRSTSALLDHAVENDADDHGDKECNQGDIPGAQLPRTQCQHRPL